MRERRQGARHVISFPIRVRWKDENGKEVIQEGLTENVGPHGTRGAARVGRPPQPSES